VHLLKNTIAPKTRLNRDSKASTDYIPITSLTTFFTNNSWRQTTSIDHDRETDLSSINDVVSNGNSCENNKSGGDHGH